MGYRDRMAEWRGRRAIRKFRGNDRVTIGSGLRLYCKLYIQGPGRLVIGENVTLLSSFFDPERHVTLCTYHEDAVLMIGDDTVLEGTRFGCRQDVRLGRGCYVGDSGIMDTDFHSTHPDHRNDPEMTRTKPVSIGDNVRIASNCTVLPGVTVGDGAVIRPSSIVTLDVPEGSTAFGFPARPQREGA